MVDLQAPWLPLFCPALLGGDALRRMPVARPPLLAKLLASLRGPLAGEHWLLHGGSGMGKTTSLQLLAASVRAEPALARRFLPIEIHRALAGITRPCELWQTVLELQARALADSGSQHEAAAIHAVIAALPERAGDRRSDAALWSLGAWADGKRGLLLCLDDLDRLPPAVVRSLSGLSAHPGITLVATTSRQPSASLVASLGGQSCVRQAWLEALDLEQARCFFQAMAAQSGDSAVLDVIESSGARFRALHGLVGTSPRNLVALGVLLQLAPTAQGFHLVERLLDLLSPGLQAQLDALAPQTRQIVLTLGRAWHPLPAVAVARSCRMDVNKASAQLARLVGAGLVRKVSLHSTRRAGFQLVDRDLALWCLVRSGPEGRRELRQLLGFLERLYAPLPPSPRPAPTARGLSLFRAKAWPMGSIDRAGLLADDPPGSGVAFGRRAPELQAADWSDASEGPGPALSRLQAAAPGGSGSGGIPCWHTCAVALRELVSAGRVAEALAVLEEHDAQEHWRPVVEALRSVLAVAPDRLIELAPEIRRPAVEVLDSLWPSADRPGA